jgi:hypothetical protein
MEVQNYSQRLTQSIPDTLSLFHCFDRYQGVSRALAENSKTFRLPTYLHERLIAIRGAKYELEDQGIAPTIEVRHTALTK